MNEPKYKWNNKLLYYHELNVNPSAIYLLKQYPQLIKPYYLSSNPYAIDLIREHINDIYLDHLSENPCAIKILENNPELIRWRYIAKNPNALHLIINNMDKIMHIDLASNENALDFINYNHISWFQLSKNPKIEHEYDGLTYRLKYKNKVVQTIRTINIEQHISAIPNAIHILEKNVVNINWYNLSSNPKAIHLIEKNLDKINWYNLCINPNAIHILEKNMNKLNDLSLIHLSANPNALHLICQYDYELMKENYKKMNQEIVEYVMNPDRLNQISITYDVPFIELVEIYG